jgi:hypothetical protein
MKNKYCRNLIRTPLIIATLSAGTSLAGTEAVSAASPTDSSPDWLKVSGYAAVSYIQTDVDSDLGDSNNDTLFDAGAPFDAVKLGLEATEGPFTAFASLFFSPVANNDAFGSGSDAGILDAYVTYKSGDFSVTGGKYLSWLGYEAFDAVNMTQMSYANSLLGAIPAYHTGVKFEYTTDVIGAGFNVSDSIRGGDGFWSGDEDYSNGLGYEAYVVYKGIDKLTLWGGVAFDTSEDIEGTPVEDFVTYDVWASYALSDQITVAAELAYSDNGVSYGTQGLAFLQYSFTEKFFTAFRFGYDNVETFDTTGYKYTVAPSYAFNDHFTLRGELSYTDINVEDTSILFTGVQALLKF